MKQGLDCQKCGAILTEHIPSVRCGSSCPECGRYAFFPDQPSYLYLLTHEQLKLHKIGIGTVGSDKDLLQKLIGEEWQVQGLWHHQDKRKTFQWEKAIFKELAALISSRGPETPGFIGNRDQHWVQSISADVITISALIKLASKIATDE